MSALDTLTLARSLEHAGLSRTAAEAVASLLRRTSRKRFLRRLGIWLMTRTLRRAGMTAGQARAVAVALLAKASSPTAQA